MRLWASSTRPDISGDFDRDKWYSSLWARAIAIESMVVMKVVPRPFDDAGYMY